jgi:predicted ATPase
MALQQRGYHVVSEAATDVIAARQLAGCDEPWAEADFIESVVGIQKRRQIEAAASGAAVELYDRSPICTAALVEYLERSMTPPLQQELDRIARERLYDRRVLFVRNIGVCEPTAARRITLAESLRFEEMHERTYIAFGYELVDVAPDTIGARADFVQARIEEWTA